MSILEILSIFFLLVGSLFFLAGTLGVLRFRDVHSRLHALSKADNLGLGLICVSLVLQAESVPVGIKILFIWLLALVASAVTCYVIAEWERKNGRPGSNL